jgi:hypothetical protein
MATTRTVMNSLVFVSTLLKNQQLSVNNWEPGMTMANNVLQWMLQPPFVWRFNRASLTFPISKTLGSDYTLSVPNLGRIESQWLTDTAGTIFELNGAVTLARVGISRRPVEVAPQYDDNQGNITFRFNSIPNQNYNANFDIQMKPQMLTSPASTFGPVPDEFGYLFNKGMLSEGALLVNDSRFEIWRKDFVAGLLATQDGLDAQAKAIFYEQMLNMGRTATRSQAAGQGGSQGRQQ